MSSEQRRHRGLDRRPRHLDGATTGNEHIYLAADPELPQIDPRLDRKTGPLQHSALVVSLIVVHVRALTMDLFVDVVARAVNEILPKALAVNPTSGDVIHLPALNRSPFAKRF